MNPLDSNARFTLEIRPASSQPTRKVLVFSPVYNGRTYTVQSTGSLTPPAWTTLTDFTVSDNGTTRTLIDLNAGTSGRFYRVQVSLP